MTALPAGCGVAATGFLSDYSRLKREGFDRRYIDSAAISRISALIIDPIEVKFHASARVHMFDRAELKAEGRFSYSAD